MRSEPNNKRSIRQSTGDRAPVHPLPALPTLLVLRSPPHVPQLGVFEEDAVDGEVGGDGPGDPVQNAQADKILLQQAGQPDAGPRSGIPPAGRP